MDCKAQETLGSQINLRGSFPQHLLADCNVGYEKRADYKNHGRRGQQNGRANRDFFLKFAADRKSRDRGIPDFFLIALNYLKSL